MNEIEKSNDAVWKMIEREKRKDKSISRISTAAWATTLLVVCAFMVLTFMDFSRHISLYKKGVISYESVTSTLVPFLIILGVFSLIVAIVMTIGRFMRLRTANLLEIQQRLTLLEQSLTKDEDLI
ncbi:hypothetical protein BFP97_10230 [Roseivirga sp. 4D4]|uniref:hypothetical protein n=1 Tax=Roseivirga sp. 4D4 TaxID=1889784 RepID=UPI000853D7CC|nr:hypothetical protein [Roseivirga sp. 4D4]OEK01868.1 hypothetical protein BFP97_10230 [Roseivirga sp. 4D4]